MTARSRTLRTGSERLSVHGGFEHTRRCYFLRPPSVESGGAVVSRTADTETICEGIQPRAAPPPRHRACFHTLPHHSPGEKFRKSCQMKKRKSRWGRRGACLPVALWSRPLARGGGGGVEESWSYSRPGISASLCNGTNTKKSRCPRGRVCPSPPFFLFFLFLLENQRGSPIKIRSDDCWRSKHLSPTDVAPSSGYMN